MQGINLNFKTLTGQWSRFLYECTLSIRHVGTWVDLSVGSDTISIHNILEPRGELVGLVVSRWSLFGLHSV